MFERRAPQRSHAVTGSLMKAFRYETIRCLVSYLHFSNSLIIHKEKTKEITTVTVVWIPDLNYHKILRTFASNFSKNYEWFEKPYQKLERVFHQVSKHLEVGQKNTAAPRFFNPLLGVWIS